MGSSTSTPPCATPNSRRGSGGICTPATGCIRPTPATRRWPTPSTSPSSTRALSVLAPLNGTPGSMRFTTSAPSSWFNRSATTGRDRWSSPARLVGGPSPARGTDGPRPRRLPPEPPGESRPPPTPRAVRGDAPWPPSSPPSHAGAAAAAPARRNVDLERGPPAGFATKTLWLTTNPIARLRRHALGEVDTSPHYPTAPHRSATVLLAWEF